MNATRSAFSLTNIVSALPQTNILIGELIKESTQAGIKAARARGIKNGRPPKLTKAQVRMAKTLLRNSASKSSDICKMLKISRSTLYRVLLKREKDGL